MLRILAVVAAAVAVCVLLFLFGLFPQEWLRPIVEREIRAALGPGSRIGRLRVVPGQLRARAEDVVIEGRGFRLEAPRLTIAIAVPTLLGRAVAIRSLTIERPILTLWPVEPASGAEPAAPFEQSVLVGGIAVTQGTLVYQDPAMGGDWRVEDVSLTGGVGEGALILATGPVRWERKPEPLVLDPIHATVSLTSLLKARIESLQMGTGRSKLIASGDIGELMKPTLDLQATVQLDLADLALVPGAPMASGVVRGQARLTGEVPAIAANGTLDGRGLQISGRRIDAANVKFSREGTKTNLTLDASALGGRLDAEAQVDGTLLQATARGHGLDLRALAGPDVPGRASLEAKLRGTMGRRLETTMHLEAAGKAATNVDYTARVDATGGLVGANYDPDLHWNATGTAKQPADPDAPTLETLDWSAEGTATGGWPSPAVNGHVSGNGRFASAAGANPFQLTGDVQTKGETISTSAVLAGTLGHMSLRATTARGTTQFAVDGREVRLDRFVAGTSGVATFAFEGRSRAGAFTTNGRGTIADLVSNEVRYGTVAVEASSDGDVTRATIRVPALKANVTATVAPLRRGASMLGVDAHVELQDTPLAPMAPLLRRPLAGTVRGTFDVRGPLAAMGVADISGRIEALDFKSGRFTGALTQPAQIQATHRRLVVRDLAVKGPGVDVKADGSFGLVPAEPHDARIQGTVDLQQLPMPVDWTAAGSAQADVRVQGTRARPLVSGGVDLTGLSANGPSVPSLQADKAHLELAGESLRIADTEARLAGGTLRLSGLIPLSAVMDTPGRAAEPAHLDLVWSGLDAAQIHFAAAPQSDVAVTGVLEGEAHVVGSLLSLSGMTARVRTPPLRLTIEQMPVTISGLTLDVAGGRATMTEAQIGTPHGSLQMAGSADLNARTIDAWARGVVDLRAFSPFMENAALTGRADLDLKLQGPFDGLRPDGRMTIRDGILRLRDIQPAVTDITGAVQFDGTHVRIPDAKARWGGGPVTISGQAAIDKGALRDADFGIKGEQMALEYLEAKFLADATLTLTGRSGDLNLAGNVVATRGLYTKNIFLEDPLRAPELKPTSTPFLQTIGLRLDVRAREFVVKNNIASLRARGTFTIRGTADEPSPFGRVTILENGSVLLQQKKFVIRDPDGATLRYEGTFSPQLSIVAETEKFDWTNRDGKKEDDGIIEVRITGDLEHPFVEFSSPTHPGLSQTEMASIIATGTEDARRLEGGELLVGQVGSLFASHLQERLSSSLRRLNIGGLGLDEVSIEPHLISGEAEPSARVTFGKNLTAWSSLAYSFSIEGTEAPFFRLVVQPLGRVKASIEREDNDTYRTRVTHRFELGAPTPRPRVGANAGQEVAVEDVRFEGLLPEPVPLLQRWAGVSAGDKRTQWDLQDNAQNIQRQLVDRGHIEAQVDARLEGKVAVFTVRAGPRYTWRVSGMTAAPDLTSTVRNALYAEGALAAGAERLLKELRGRGHHKAVVRTETQGEGDERTLVFAVEPGPAYAAADIVFDGASVLSKKVLLRTAGGIGEFLIEPARARRRVEERYREEFFLETKVGRPLVQESASRLTVKVPIEEGRQAHIARVTFSGSSLHPDELNSMTAGLVGAAPDPFGVPGALLHLRERYFELGYPEVRVSSRLVPVDGDVEMRVEIHEGPQVHVREIAFEGRSRVSERLLRSALPFKEGDPLDPRKLGRAEVKLAEYKVRARVTSDPADTARVVVTMRRSAKLVADYGLQMDTSSRPGFTADVRAPNLLPRGITPAFLVSELEHDRRLAVALTSPALLHRGLLDISFVLEDKRRNLDGSIPGTGGVEVPQEELLRTLTRRGRVAQRIELANRWRFEYGYDLAHVSTTAPVFVLPIEADIGKTRFSLLRDTRDSLLDARRGRLWTISFNYAPKAFGTDFELVKAFGQVSVYRPLTPQLTWAHAYRLGLGHGIGGPLFFNERFTTGGTSSLRGYANDTVGPLDPVTERPGPGDALVVLNQELRYHHATGLGAVIFYDVGNVYDKIKDIDLELRHSIGAGLRYASPVGLLRVDFGVPLNRRPKVGDHEIDDRYQIFFSLGQAF